MKRKSQIANRKSNPPLPLRYYTGGQVPRRTGIGQSSSGFTLIELIVVIICLSILMFAIGVRYNRNKMSSAVSADQLVADIRYVQLKAISIGRPYKITFPGGNSYSMSRTDTAESEKETKKLPGDEIATADICTTLQFNTLGEPNIASDCTLSLSGDGTIKVKIYNITGKAESLSL